MVHRLGKVDEAGMTVAGKTSLSWGVWMPSRAQMEDRPHTRVTAQAVGPTGRLEPMMVG